MTTDLVKIARRDPSSSFGKGATPAQIRDAASKLRVSWPRSFEKFLLQIGWFESGLLTVYGLGSGTPRHLNLVRMARDEREAWNQIVPMPSGLVPISPDGRGGHYCLDTARLRGDECPVVYWDHELVEPGYEPQYASKNFETYFRRHAPRPERPEPATITAEKAIAAMTREAKRWGNVGQEKWTRGSGAPAIRQAERCLRVQLPAPVRTLLREAGGFEHAGGWEHLGVSTRLPPMLSLLHHARRLRRKSARNKRLIPLARSWVSQLCCVDLDSAPLSVVAIDFDRLTRLRKHDPLPFEVWLWRMAKGKLDPWNPV
jgi:hypothetical protein